MPPSPMTRTHQLGELQLAIMRELWSAKEATVAQVHAALLEERGLALTTIATMLSKMEKKGVITHRTEGRQFVYEPIVSESAVNRTMVSDLTERLFGGQTLALVNHLLTEQEIDTKELAEISRLIAEHQRSDSAEPVEGHASESKSPKGEL
ncbi:MAG: BlaI family penicillinase repressor [Planctomycetota bacterium]|jgi:BlaI family penicillinase repressor